MVGYSYGVPQFLFQDHFQDVHRKVASGPAIIGENESLTGGLGGGQLSGGFSGCGGLGGGGIGSLGASLSRNSLRRTTVTTAYSKNNNNGDDYANYGDSSY